MLGWHVSVSIQGTQLPRRIFRLLGEDPSCDKNAPCDKKARQKILRTQILPATKKTQILLAAKKRDKNPGTKKREQILPVINKREKARQKILRTQILPATKKRKQILPATKNIRI